jgi:hypothetical protein
MKYWMDRFYFTDGKLHPPDGASDMSTAITGALLEIKISVQLLKPAELWFRL